MDPVLAVVIACAAVVAAVLVVEGTLLARRRGRLAVGSPVIVCTRRPDDQSIHGVVARHDRHGIGLDAAHYLDPDGDKLPMGAVWVPADAVAFVQTGVAPVEIRSGAPPARPAPVPLPDTRLAAAVAERSRRIGEPRDPVVAETRG